MKNIIFNYMFVLGTLCHCAPSPHPWIERPGSSCQSYVGHRFFHIKLPSFFSLFGVVIVLLHTYCYFLSFIMFFFCFFTLQSIRGKWRCTQCQLRRELMCKTGTWYHGDEAGDFLYSSESMALQKLDSDETIVPAVDVSDGAKFDCSPQLLK